MKPSLFVSGQIFSNLGTFLFIQYQTLWPKSPLAAFEVKGKPLRVDSVPKKLDCSLLALQSIIQKNAFQWKILDCRQKDRELAVFTFWYLPQFRFKVSELIWPRVDWFWSFFCWNVPRFVVVISAWNKICKNCSIVFLIWRHEVFSMISLRGILVCSLNMPVFLQAWEMHCSFTSYVWASSILEDFTANCVLYYVLSHVFCVRWLWRRRG